MVIKCQKPSDRLIGRLANDYYLANERLYGQSFCRNISLKKCAVGDFTAPIPSLFDLNYALTNVQVKAVWEDDFCNFVGLYADNGFLVAHTTITFSLEKNGALVANVSEIHIYQKEHLKLNEDLSFVYGIYRNLIMFIQSYLTLRYSNIERIDLITSNIDEDFFEVTKDLGYDIIDSAENNKQVKICKYLYERNMTYERRNINQQN